MADAEALLVTFLTAAFPGSFVCTETPADLDTIASTIKVLALPGGRRFTLTTPGVSIDCFASGTGARQTARALALAVDEAVTWQLQGHVVASVAVSAVSTVASPAWRPYDNSGLRRFGATYRLSLCDA